MTCMDELLENAFVAPELPKTPKEKVVPNFRKRHQLLSYDDVTKLSDVMETAVPIHGKGNFPTLEVTPSTLVQMVREGLSKEGIRVPNVRLNGSAATHVLSGDKNHSYKDLDLIFAVDMSMYSSPCPCHPSDPNSNNSNNHFRKTGDRKHQATRRYSPAHRRAPPGHKEPVQPRHVSGTTSSTPGSRSRIQSHERPTDLSINSEEVLDSEISHACGPKSANRGELPPSPTSPRSILNKAAEAVEFSVVDVDFEDVNDKDSGYTSSGSSVSSLPVSPSGFYQPPIRSRTHSLDSSSSVTSSSSFSGNRVEGHRTRDHNSAAHLDVQAKHRKGRWSYRKDTNHQDTCTSSKELGWQKIKDVVMEILCQLLPDKDSRSCMSDVVLTGAYVQKMVKINNDSDRWSLISLNNNAGRNLELKFVENMRRQYEFSVDSFQIILDSYQRFKFISKALEAGGKLELSTHFYPSVLAESVYGDFASALRHLRHRRICTHRPEEIRGGGLLRYCNLLVRDYTPGEVPGCESVSSETTKPESDSPVPTPTPSGVHHSLPLSSGHSTVTSLSYSSARSEDVCRLEQLMCSRFFIDFSEFSRQKMKLLSYLDSHFACEDEIKFQYLLILRRVVDKSTVCLMSEERSMIVDFITKKATETLAKTVGTQPQSIPSATEGAPTHQAYNLRLDEVGQSYQYRPTSPMVQFPYFPPPPNYSQRPMYRADQNLNNNCNVPTPYYAPYNPPTVTPNYAPPNCFTLPNPNLSYNQSSFPCQNGNAQFVGYAQPPMTCCPCCHAVYPQMGNTPPYFNQEPPKALHQGMSVNSAPFYPSKVSAGVNVDTSSTCQVATQVSCAKPVYLPANAKLFYTPATHKEIQNVT